MRLLFARDWLLEGKKFRTTWTAGWWLSRCATESRLTTLERTSHHLTAEREAELYAIFDVNNDGVISQSEFVAVMLPSGLGHPDLMALWDSPEKLNDGSGSI